MNHRLTPGPLMDFCIETCTDTDSLLQLADLMHPQQPKQYVFNRHDWEQHKDKIIDALKGKP